ncbi:hypothetical protein QAD02_012855 [Eretmocerus hayati]|uniref:Uncharacterized protein n=1 Tax=Eretmocerus hayati TaxID=131215 RepID=A0ACC2P1S3_9HYME|nr:hypothetical protein QAD02_012855 [Eretmocerus hayati]
MEEESCHECLVESADACAGEIILLKDLPESERAQAWKQTGVTSFCQLHLKQQLNFFTVHQNSCCDPLMKHKKTIRTQLYDVTDDYYESVKNEVDVVPGQKLCSNCMYIRIPQWLEERSVKKLLDELTGSQTSDPKSQSQGQLSGSQSSSSGVSAEYRINEAKSKIMEVQQILEIPNFQLEITSKRSIDESFGAVVGSVAKKMKILNPELKIPNLKSDSENAAYFKEVIEQLKEKLPSCKDTKEKYRLLSILPKSWSAYQIQKAMEVSKYTSIRVKRLVEDQGIFCLVPSKTNRPLDRNVLQKIKEFYDSDDTSRIMPGIWDYVAHEVDGSRVESQKRLLLCNLKEAYQHFKDSNPDILVGFTRFAEARPPYIILAGASGTHTVCVCKIHQNFKLLLHGLDLESLDETNKNWTYHHVLSRIKCNPPTLACHFGNCASCPGVETVIDEIKTLLSNENITQVTFKQWTSTDRSFLETLTLPVEVILKNLPKSLKDLREHDFIAKEQSRFLKQRRESLLLGEALACGDFSQNLAFTLQDEVQEHLWNNDQCTIHPWVVYFRNSKGEIEHINIIMITDRLKHDTSTVYTFQKHLIRIVKEKIGYLTKMIYMTDGASGQYKNKTNFLNLCHHCKDFGLDGEWHFCATSHGKGACDGLGGCLKRSVKKASLQRPTSGQIQTVEDLVQWTKTWDSKIITLFVPNREIEESERFLDERSVQALILLINSWDMKKVESPQSYGHRDRVS